ncbi:MAG: hypothetical protein ABJA67_01715 [Chthonomonadales bacterium]
MEGITMDNGSLIREKLNEYLMTIAPLERAEEDIAFSRRILRAKTEDEIHHIAPALAALAEALNVSTIEMLLAPDRVSFVKRALEKSSLSMEEITARLIEASSTANEDLKLLGFGDSLQNE